MSHIYVVGFGASGLIKVGYTANPKKRIADHVRDGRVFLGSECRTWVSTDHPRAAKNERELIAWCGAGDGEYFRIPFDAAVAFAKTLDFSPLTDEEIAADAARAAALGSLREQLFPSRPALSEEELEAILEPDGDGIWRVRADDSADADRIVRLDSNMGLAHLNLELIGCDGLLSPTIARLLAYRLLLSAHYAEEATLVPLDARPSLAVVA